jgi:GNAT superfamily N-acetyltransferase
VKRIVDKSEKYKISISDAPESALRNQIHEHIKSFNDAISENHRAARVSGTLPLNIIVWDNSGSLVGGLIADTYWGWLDIDDFWIAEEMRGNGLGKRLLEIAEQEAVARSCLYAQLKTFSFQARGFYEKCGYRVTGVLQDYPPGHALYWMRKELKR